MNRLSPDADDARFLRRVVMVIVLAALTVAIWRAGDLIILAFGSVLGAITIHALAYRLAKHAGVPKRFSVPVAMAMLVAFVSLFAWLFAAQFGEQINVLILRTPQLLAELADYLSRSPAGAKLVDAIRAAYAGSQVARDVGQLARGGGALVLNLLLLVVGALFFAVQPRTYLNGFLLLVPSGQRPAYRDALIDLGKTLRLWLRAQIILMTTMGVLIGIGLWISGVPSAAALGFLAGLSEFIPYIGPTVAMLPALGLAATQGTGPLVGALTTYAVVRLLQSNFITPYVQNRVIAIPPAITLFAILAIGSIFGLFGLFFSAALLVVIFSLMRSLYLREVLGETLDEPPEPPATRA